jgi:hypothetical protein
MEQAENIVVDLDKATDEAAKELILRLDNGRMQWRLNTAIVGVKAAGNTHFSTNQSCHAGLGNMAPCKRVVNALMDGEGYDVGRVLDDEVELWFVDYILNRSAYAETFITKDAKLALEQRYTVSDGDHPANLMAAGMVALRRLWEYPYVAKAAYDLAQAGVNEDLAFLLGHLISTKSNPDARSNARWDSCHNGHCSVNPAVMGWKSVKNFLDHKVIQPKGLFSHGAGYMGYDAMYGERQGESYYKYVSANFPYDLCEDDGKGAPNLNPFQASINVVARNQVPYGKAIKVMAEWVKTTLMEKINNA